MSGTYRIYICADSSKLEIDDIRIDNVPIQAPISNVTIKIHEYNGNYSTSPYISGIAYFSGVPHNVTAGGSTYSINNGVYDNITITSSGYDSVMVQRTINEPTTIEVYLLKQNEITVDYSVVDSITGALVPSPTVEIHDIVTGTVTTVNNNLGSINVLKDHLVYFNATKTGYGSAIQNYTFTGATQIRLYLISPLVAPEGQTYVTFHVRDNYANIYTGIAGVDVQVNGQRMTTDESGLATILINSTVGSYAWIASKIGYYPTTGVYGLNTVQGNIVDVQLTPRTTSTNGTSQVDTGIIQSYKDIVDGTIGSVTGLITGGIDILITPVGILNGSVSTIRTTVDGGMGFAGNSTNVFTDLFGVIIFGLPWQVKGLITYYLAWLLALMFLNR